MGASISHSISGADGRKNSAKHGAFSLVEILVVAALAAILLGLVVPAMSSIVRGTKLNQAGQMAVDAITLARQEAVSRNSEVQVVFFRIDKDGLDGWRAFQIWRMEDNGAGPTRVPVGRLQVLPEPIVFTDSATYSPLISNPPISGVTNLPNYGNLNYVGFRFHARGDMGGTFDPSANFLTLQNVTEATPPVNFYTIQVHPVTGRTTVFRP